MSELSQEVFKGSSLFSSYMLTRPLQATEDGRRAGDTAFGKRALQMGRLLPELFSLGAMLTPRM